MIAYRLMRAGKHKAKVRAGRDWLPIRTGVMDDDGREIEIATRDVGKYFDQYFQDALDIYNDTVLFEMMPFSGGWAEQPYEVYRILKILKAEANRWEHQERGTKHGKERNPRT